MHPQIGETLHGFLVTNHIPLEELQSTYIELVHLETGAEVIHLANNDSENLFSLSFQTLPSSSNGVAHILEHTVLCGSKKFPVKDPFFAMTRRSLNTYMNALTGQDFTCYPASSQVEKDFYHLLEVYLDAVFHPKLNLLSFLQEGHRLAFSEIDNPNSPLLIEGVVYNEMKGAFLGSDGRLWHHLFKALTPDLPYAYDSGGDPKEIPSLTHEELIEFHRIFYHPSRCLFFFYGNLPLTKHLSFLNKHALQNVKKEPFLPPLPPQPRFHAPKHVEGFYPISPNEPSAKKTIIALALLTASIAKQEDLLALNLIDSLLTDTDVSPLKFALLKSGLCTNVESSLNLEMSEVPWVLVCKGCEEQDSVKIAEVVRTTLEELCLKGFDPKAIEASLHQLEFERTEILGGDAPFGLHLFFRAALAKQHGADPTQALLLHSLFSDLREKLKNSSYLPSLVRTYLLTNPHSVLLTLKPDPTLQQKEQEEEKQKIVSLRSSLTSEEIQRILKQQKELVLYQEEQEHQSLDCLPKVTLNDVSAHAKDFPLMHEQQNGLPIFHHSCFTNHILYADLGFDLPSLKFEELPLVSLLARFVTEVGSGGRSYAETLEFQQASVGELSASLQLYLQQGQPGVCKPAISFRAKALQRNTSSMFSLLHDYSFSAHLEDPSRIQELLHQHATHLQNRLPKHAMNYAIQLALSGFSSSATIQQEWHGLPYFQFILRCLQKDPKELSSQLAQIYQNLFDNKSFLVLSCDQSQRQHLNPILADFSTSLTKKQPTTSWDGVTPVLPVAHQGRIIASPVAFSVLAFSVQADSAPLLIATDLLQHLVLHRQIREQGGAYGAGATYSPLTGNFYFYSYRDPHIARTYHSFLKSIDQIGSGKFSEQELEEAKLSILQDLDAPLPPGQRAIAAYGWLRSARTFSHRDSFRKAVLNTSKEELTSALNSALNGKEGVFVSFSGEDLLKKESKKLPFSFEIQGI